jgi:fumarylacetoacetase
VSGSGPTGSDPTGSGPGGYGPGGYGPANLPYGVDQSGRVVVAYGDQVIDLASVEGLDVGPEVWTSGSLNAFMALGPDAWARTRAQLQQVVAGQPARARRPLAEARLTLAWEVGDYTDFYASRQHAEAMGRLLRPGEDPLPPAWLHLPIGYHGRAGTVVVSGSPVPRPAGLLPAEGGAVFGPTARLDVEVELGFVVGTTVPRGQSIPARDADRYVFGVVLVNDWSARDIQSFEYRPLGPFLGKSFATSVSPWVVPLAALEPWRVDGPVQDPRPADYLRVDEPRGLDVGLSLAVNGSVLSNMTAAGLYWSMAQQLAHLTVNGAGVRAGDLFASGTISGGRAGEEGSLMEKYAGGRWLADGDRVTIRGWCGDPGRGPWLSLGEVDGTVVGHGGGAQ